MLVKDRLDAILSHRMKTIRNVAIVEICAPRLDRKFQGENASG